MVYQETSAAKALSKKFKLTLNDQMGFLAGMVGVAMVTFFYEISEIWEEFTGWLSSEDDH
jgi:hypothetical protein